MKRPLISIITVVYNASRTLESTIKSVLSQDGDLFEYWIIDGGSTDGSLDIICQYADKLGGWISEPDEGIYDAMNKGIDRAKGDWIYFIGGDDTLRPGIIKEIESHLNRRYSIVFGDVLFDNGHRMRSFLGPRTVFQNTVHHQSAFYNAALFANYRYDPTLTIVSEYDIHLQVYMHKSATNYVPLIIADCAVGGASSDLPRSLKETNIVRARYLPSKWKNRVLSTSLRLYYAQKRLRFLLYGHRV